MARPTAHRPRRARLAPRPPPRLAPSACAALTAIAALASLPVGVARADDPTSTRPTVTPTRPVDATVDPGTEAGASPGAPVTTRAPGAEVPAAAPAAPPTTVAPSPTDATTKAAALTPPAGDVGRFEFGSYGRVRFASDGRGGTGRQANIVSHGSRIDEESYVEVELRREDTFTGDIHTKIVTTFALFPPFFHFSGSADQQIAVRNLYVQANQGNYNVWVGSRMYRGDDIYLLDWWPLDNQNTLGGGVGARFPADKGDTTVAAHVGMQRLDNPYQYQQIPVVAPYGFGAVQVTKLDRPRLVETLKVAHTFRESASTKAGLKAIAYGEAHQLAAGTSLDTVTNEPKALPADTGVLLGGELAYWTGERDTFVQLFVRHARGVAAYDPLSVPTTFANDKTTSGSTETLIALGGNWERDAFAVLVGGYLRFFRDGGASATSTQKFDEGTVVVRPQLFVGEHWGLALEGSYQQRRLAFLDPSGNEPLKASLVRGAIMPFFSPAGRGSYKRPQIRAIYAVTARDAGARALYAAEDVFAQRKVEHFIGLGAEWWFNSSTYP